MEFFNTTQLLYVLRMVIAALCGCVIGLERKNRSKEAGIRTHCVVACASALIMVISKYGFADVTVGINGMRGAGGVPHTVLEENILSYINFPCHISVNS